ncbi:MAG: hypothetical protein QOG89_1070, partial [Thermomicrobiales bacterium]|nr:hypothetical protein [Thermomicrobiales bacterium]
MAPLARGLLVTAAVAAALVVPALIDPAPAADSGSRVLVAAFENDVNPVTQEYLIDAIERGEREGYAAVVIEMDTPGGLGSSMRAIVKGIVAAKVPVI